MVYLKIPQARPDVLLSIILLCTLKKLLGLETVTVTVIYTKFANAPFKSFHALKVP